jgi:hypothetical protein
MCDFCHEGTKSTTNHKDVHNLFVSLCDLRDLVENDGPVDEQNFKGQTSDYK